MSRPTRSRPALLAAAVAGATALPLWLPLSLPIASAPSSGAAAAAAAASAASTTVAATPSAGSREALDTSRRILVVTVDGLRSSALEELGAEELPTFTRLRQEGAGTLDARTVREQTATLPNHTSILTGRRIDARRGGHGVTWNTDIPGRTVQQAAGGPVGSVLSRVHGAGGSTALFAGKSKFSLFERSWPRGTDRYTYDARGARLVRKARRDLRRESRTLTFLHLSAPDVAGHAHGWASPQYAEALRTVDGWLADILRSVASKPVLRRNLTVLLTSDHGGQDAGHADPSSLANARIPFLTWGVGVAAADLYDLNGDYRAPGQRIPGYAADRQPVRNADVANLALDLLGLRSIPGSGIGEEQALDLK